MQVDIDHVLFWMDAIRNSDDRYRTLESFWKGQVHSKIWLIENLKPFVTTPSNVDIFGGWNGVLSSLMFQSSLPIVNIRSVDIDPSCELVASTVNKIEEMQGRFSTFTSDMSVTNSTADIVINTSCEHVTKDQYSAWLDLMPKNSLVVLQSNNYYQLDEHINCVDSVDDLVKDSNLTTVFFKDTLILPKYNRFMIIGKK